MALSFVFWLSFFHLTVTYFASSMQQQPTCRDDERLALLQFKDSLIIHKPAFSWDPPAHPKVASWNLQETNSDCCSWDGVKCNEETGHVIRLDLSSSCLYGSINSTSTLFRLVHLQWLSLAYNDFNSSEIPATIKHLSRLKHLNLSSSHFSRQIPSELLDLSNLVSLDLSYNYYPPTNLELQNPGLRSLVEKLTNLKVLNLRRVYIASSVPHSLANLSSLTYLSLEECELQGEFPAQIFQLPNLSFLSLSFNEDLTGYIPSSLESGNSLTFVDIHSCNFSGTIPSSIGNLTKLIYLYVYFNNFSQICHDDDRSALLQFKKSLIINKTDFPWDPSAYPKVASWNLEEENGDCCSWNGVECNVETGHVIKLDLSSRCLYGSINSTNTLFHLVHLQWLSLADNHFNSSEIPATINNLSSNNKLQGNPGLCGKPLSKECEHFEPSKKEDEDTESPFAFDWKIVLIGYACGLIIGMVLGHTLWTRNHEWFVKILGCKRMKKKRGRRN
ncbi:hypothetical protein EZV62_020774 [Acer yangbiense]|uniref:Leucine-rich repeat-containing N-terminal plant-type domain-containing protein n=1 Tax=Acer yangbiense TaxID=1000413 RepID=A0A5C7HFK4_9ROSI|nr:hypothetical protein EZV62_020774 [Acer yangbiense]